MGDKRALFEKLKRKGLFYSYSKDITYENLSDNLLIEYVLKYADFDDIKEIIEIFGVDRVKAVWEKSMKTDRRFIKVNLMIARVFFNMDVESDYFKGLKSERFKGIRVFNR
ncbi:hypothetical protein [Hippea alviniae]|uniref:hypothetical protein n=1 Tax=Hippea alviniae TaxID=1279027 RepID=UPI0004230334|nr:hypothetical protein [Hippea alviniae]